MRKKAQAWGFDLIIGLTIFLFGVLFFYLYVVNIPLSEDDEFDELRNQAASIADSLMSEGSPVNWDRNDVIRIGLLTDGRIDESKLAEFEHLASNEYQRSRSLFRVTNDYFVYFNDSTNYVGKYLDITNESVVRVTRVVIRNNKTNTLNVVSWR